MQGGGIHSTNIFGPLMYLATLLLAGCCFILGRAFLRAFVMLAEDVGFGGFGWSCASPCRRVGR